MSVSFGRTLYRAESAAGDDKLLPDTHGAARAAAVNFTVRR